MAIPYEVVANYCADSACTAYYMADQGMPKDWQHTDLGFFCAQHNAGKYPGAGRKVFTCTVDGCPNQAVGDELPASWTKIEGGIFTEYYCLLHGPGISDSSNTVLSVLDELRHILTSKQKDYAGGSDPFKNFKESAHIATIGSGSKVTDKQSAFALLGTKISRVGNLEASSSDPQNEPLIDSYRDLAGYAIMLYAMAKETQ